MLHVTNTNKLKTFRASFQSLAFSGCALLLVLTLTATAQARTIPFQTEAQYSYRLEDKLLGDFLQSFMAEQGYQVVISEQILAKGQRLNGIRKGTPDEIFTSILNTNNLVPYFDGSKVYLYQLSEMLQRYVAVAGEDVRPLKQAIQSMSLHDAHNFTGFNSGTGLVSISGTPTYVDQIQGIIHALNIKNLNAASEFQYFALKHAWATDRVFTVGGREVTIPGVATILRQAIGEQPTTLSGHWDEATPSQSESLKGKGMAALGKAGEKANPVLAAVQPQKNENTQADHQGPAFIPERPTFVDNGTSRVVADPHHNGLIIRDLPERMPLYAKLIKTLDSPTPIVEIEATIIDINIDKLEEQGIQWRFGQNNLEALFARSGGKEHLLDSSLRNSVTALEQISGFQLGAIIGNHQQLVAQLNLLEQEGLVSITSRPRVATLNDLDAVIESGHSLYVPVQGAFETDLFKVYSGTILRVTPHIIIEGPEKQIRLIISVEDGNVEMLKDANGSSVPMSTRNAVVTQAVVNNGHSLLLGGLVREKSIQQADKIPGIGDIPLLGKLFSNNSEAGSRSERMYIISPKLITSDSSDNAAQKLMSKVETDAKKPLSERAAALIKPSRSSTELCGRNCDKRVEKATPKPAELVIF